MEPRHLIPWRVRHAVSQWMESRLRPARPGLYKLLKFGRRNLNTPAYWDEVWRTDTVNRDYSVLYERIAERVPLGARVLDVGCGAGNLARALRDQREARVTGLDFSAWACEQLAKEGFETVVSVLPRIPFPDDSFDVAVATEVLEHLDRPSATLEEMARVVRPGGAVMCSVPDEQLLPHEELEHQHAFDRKILAALLRRVSSENEIVSGPLRSGTSHGFLLGWVRVA